MTWRRHVPAVQAMGSHFKFLCNMGLFVILKKSCRALD